MPREKLRILLIDDDEDDLYLTSRHLTKIEAFEIDIEKEGNYKQAREKVFKNLHDVYIVDYVLGPNTGLDLLNEATTAGIKKPFILLTGKGDRKIDMEAAKAGAYDYLTKSDLSAELLERSLRYSMQRYMAYTVIAESEKRYREIFDRSNDIIFLLDKDFRFVDFNPVLTKYLGYTPEELSHREFKAIFENQQDAGKLQQHIDLSKFNGELELKLLAKSGEVKTFLGSFSRFLSPDGNWLYQGILHDYTEIKKSVEEQLFREKLEATGRIVRSLAHEIRNPLTNINLSVHQLEESATEEKQVYADIIKRNSKRINDLIIELMNISEPVENKFERFELNQLVRSALLNARDRIELKKIGVSENFIAEELFVLGDQEKIRIAVLNIIINAIEAIEGENGKLELETSVNDDKACIRIRDNGSGISPEHLSDLFQPYFTRKKNGIGLGLANTHAIIRAHNGNIRVESAPGAGSTFTVSLEAV